MEPGPPKLFWLPGVPVSGVRFPGVPVSGVTWLPGVPVSGVTESRSPELYSVSRSPGLRSYIFWFPGVPVSGVILWD